MLQVGVLKNELERMNSENERLKELLNQATNKYNGLQVHLQTIIQEQQKGAAEGNKSFHGNGPSMHRQLVEVGTDISSSEGAAEDGLMAGGEGNQSPGQKFLSHSASSNGVDQATEATIRKARVSVRARTESPMV